VRILILGQVFLPSRKSKKKVLKIGHHWPKPTAYHWLLLFFLSYLFQKLPLYPVYFTINKLIIFLLRVKVISTSDGQLSKEEKK